MAQSPSMRSGPSSPGPRRGLPRAARAVLPWLAVTLVAALVAIPFAYKVSLTPPALHPRGVVFAAAETQVLVDNSPSALVYDGADKFREEEYDLYTPKQAVLLSQYLETQGPLQQMAAAAGIPGQVVSASGPFTAQLDQATANLIQTGPQVGDPPRTNRAYRLLVDVDSVRPMITLYSQAPTVAAAMAIVNTARQELFSYTSAHEQGVYLPPMKRMVLRSMGATTGGVVDPGAKTQLLAVVFGVVFILGAMLLLAIRRRAFWRGIPAWARPSQDIAVPDDRRDVWPHTRRFLPWTMAVFMGLLFLVPIDAILASGNSGGGTSIAPTLDRVLLTMMIIGWLAKVRSPRRFATRLTQVHATVILFAGLCFLGVALNGFELAVNQEVMYTVKKIVLLMTFITFFFVAADVLRPDEIRPLLKLLIALGVICAVGTIIERETRWNVFYSIWNGVLPLTKPPEMDTLDDIGRLGVVGPTGEPLELATLLALVLPFSIVFALDSKTRRERLWYLTATMIVMAGALATARKTSIVAPLVGVLVLIAYRPRPMLRGLLKAALPLFIVIHFVVPGQLGSVLTELLPSHATSVNTDKVRVARYDAVRPDVMSHLVLGRGFHSYDPIKYRFLDDEYLGLLIGTGVLGTVVFLAIFGSVYTLSHPLIRGPDESRRGLALALQSAMVMIMVASALFDTLSFFHVSYLLFYFAAMVIALRKPVRQVRPRRTGQMPDGYAHGTVAPVPSHTFALHTTPGVGGQ